MFTKHAPLPKRDEVQTHMITFIVEPNPGLTITVLDKLWNIKTSYSFSCSKMFKTFEVNQ
jgi:hypothetical protein